MTKRLSYKDLILIIVLLIFMSAVLGCAAEQPEAPAPAPEPAPEPSPAQPEPAEPEPTADISTYMPMKVGTIWEYEGEGNEYASYTVRVEFEKDNRYQLTKDNGGAVIANIYEVRDDSIVNVYQMGEEYDHKNILNAANNYEDTIIKLPIQVGNKWTSEENSYEIIDTKASITVPYGTFKDCVVVKLTYKDGSESYMHYKEGIGMLQSEFRTEDTRIYSRLKSFSEK